ncbi:CHC2 zinc finger domain-containing protein [Roseivirga sp. UBA838]|uniref:CHC2 zinc finger domain-containing protein n=1 Tax=Roseivirga sp. UBA838 TaxID=1947393 RepID=UPI00257A8EB4|nr:CHC2 zinc finger domain-containing protein [Roseivirga sp. UBA838]|tara:strand:- start:30884 stop:31345 length:462 start_codon:yes stop_codon:yes gene_type:complete
MVSFPFRDEQTPSFTVDVSKNIWNDFGEAGIGSKVCAGGGVIDYMMKYHGTDAKGALEEINKPYNGSPQKPSPKATKKDAMPKTNMLEIISMKKVLSMALFHYLEARKIPPEIGLPYPKQVQFRHIEKKTEGFALGLENARVVMKSEASTSKA